MFRYVFTVSVLLFGFLAIVNYVELTLNWIILTLSIYALPLLLQLLPYIMLRVSGIWIGVFLVAQSFIGSVLYDSDYITLIPNYDERRDIKGSNIPGISGIQHITTDSNGFRTTKNISYNRKSDKTFRIFAVGGSTTEQIYLDDRKTWTHILQERLNRLNKEYDIEVINTGVSGLRARHHLATIKEVERFEPDMIVLMVGINDWNKHIREKFNKNSSDNWFIESLRPLNIKNSLIGKLYIQLKNNSRRNASKGKVNADYGDNYSKYNDSLHRDVVYEFKPTSVTPEYSKYIGLIEALCKTRAILVFLLLNPRRIKMIPLKN